MLEDCTLSALHTEDMTTSLSWLGLIVYFTTRRAFTCKALAPILCPDIEPQGVCVILTGTVALQELSKSFFVKRSSL